MLRDKCPTFLVPLPNPHCPLFPSFPPIHVITMNMDDSNTPKSSSIRHISTSLIVLTFSQSKIAVLPFILCSSNSSCFTLAPSLYVRFMTWYHPMGNGFDFISSWYARFWTSYYPVCTGSRFIISSGYERFLTTHHPVGNSSDLFSDLTWTWFILRS